MRAACITYTDSGQSIAEIIESGMKNVTVFRNSDYDGGIKSIIGDIFKSYDRIAFICAAGIAVRMIAPYVRRKTVDPAVVVVDDMGRYSISLLSGHIGGANELAREIADLIGAEAVITTGSDARGIEGVDMFAQRYGLEIESMEDAKEITSIMVNGGGIRLISEIETSINYGNISDDVYKGCILVTSQERVDCLRPYCVLRPKNLNIGIGCRRGKSSQHILNAIYEVFRANNLSMKSIKSVSSIDVKRNENGIIEACHILGCKFMTFSAMEIRSLKGMFTKSAFVESKVGVPSVAEPCACLGGGKLIVGKNIINGVTIAVARED